MQDCFLIILNDHLYDRRYLVGAFVVGIVAIERNTTKIVCKQQPSAYYTPPMSGLKVLQLAGCAQS